MTKAQVPKDQGMAQNAKDLKKIHLPVDVPPRHQSASIEASALGISLAVGSWALVIRWRCRWLLRDDAYGA